MFGIKTLTVSVESAVKAATARTLKGADDAGIARYNAVRDYVALSYAADKIDADLTDRAYAMLKDCKSYDARMAARKEFVHVYQADYAARFPQGDAEKMKSAADMAWSRVMTRAASKGWVKPESTSKAATASKGKRATDKAASGKADGRKAGNNTGKGKAQAAQAAETSAIVSEMARKADPEMAAALAWVNANTANKAAFLEWFKAQRAAQLSGTEKKAA